MQPLINHFSYGAEAAFITDGPKQPDDSGDDGDDGEAGCDDDDEDGDADYDDDGDDDCDLITRATLADCN